MDCLQQFQFYYSAIFFVPWLNHLSPSCCHECVWFKPHEMNESVFLRQCVKLGTFLCWTTVHQSRQKNLGYVIYFLFILNFMHFHFMCCYLLNLGYVRFYFRGCCSVPHIWFYNAIYWLPWTSNCKVRLYIVFSY